MNFLKLFRVGNIQRALFASNNIHTSAVSRLKEIHVTKTEKELLVEGVIVPSPREHQLLKPPENHNGACLVCASGLDIKHTDVLILSQFLRSDGCMLPRRITGLCSKQQRRMSIMVAMAQKAGLMPNIGPRGSKKDPRRRYKWKKYNTYFDESTIEKKRKSKG